VPTRWPESENISPQVTRRRSFSSKYAKSASHILIFIATLHHAPACGQGSLLNRNPAQEFEVGENLGCAEHHAAQRVVGDAYRQPSLFPDSLVQVLEQGTASGKHNAAVADVGRKFRRRALQS